MLALVAALLVTAIDNDKISSLDKYKINISGMNIHEEYTSIQVNVHYNSLKADQLWKSGVSGLNLLPSRRSAGTWGFDGKTERYAFDLQEPSTNDASGSPDNLNTLRNITLLFDGTNYAVTLDGGKTIEAARNSQPQYLPYCKGPFQCWGYPFSSVLHEFENILPRR